MYSLNVPVPGAVARLAADLHPSLVGFDSIRDRHTLLVKRFGDAPPGGVPRLEQRLRTALAGTPAFEARVAGIDRFDRPPRGDGPVVYLSVESPGIHDLHRRLLAEFDPVADLEGDDYTPHVTLARGGDDSAAAALSDRAVDSVTWTVSRLCLWDGTYGEPVTEFSLPA